MDEQKQSTVPAKVKGSRPTPMEQASRQTIMVTPDESWLLQNLRRIEYGEVSVTLKKSRITAVRLQQTLVPPSASTKVLVQEIQLS
ncbi:MAG TPA: hypothetical protein VGN26_23165 [Armatimonadota bacterium]